nr:hypothetical protein [Tanacetum cinerariifolium]
MINQAIKDSKEYKTYLAFATGEATPKKARKFKKIPSLSKKQSLDIEDEHVKKPKRAKHPEPAKKPIPATKDVSSKKPSTSVQIRDTPGVFVSKKKAPAKVDRCKGMNLLSDVALLEAAQLKKVLKRSKQDTHIPHKSGSNSFESENESWEESGDDSKDDDISDDDDNDDDGDDDGGDNVSKDERTESDDDENLNLNKNDDDEEEEYDEGYEEECKREVEEVEQEDEGKGDVEKIIDGHDDVTQETTYEQVKDDEHVTLTTVCDIQKTKVPLQSSYVSSDFAT